MSNTSVVCDTREPAVPTTAAGEAIDDLKGPWPADCSPRPVTTLEVSSIAEAMQLFGEPAFPLNPLSIWFRGHRDSSYALQPSVQRDFSRSDESSMLTYFRAGAPARAPVVPSETNLSEWLTLAQHWELPTRLLDWTTSLLVACYFATEIDSGGRDPQADSAVWMLDPFEMNRRFDKRALRFPIGSGTARPYVEAAFYDEAEEKGDYLAVLAAERNMRVFAQQGAFTIHSSRDPLEEDDFAGYWLAKFVIPAQSVSSVRVEARVLGATISSIYPDLGSLAKRLRSDHLGTL